MSDKTTANILTLTSKIVAAHIANNQLDTGSLPSLITTVYQSLATAGAIEPIPEAPTPAVPWKKSVFPDYIICLEDGKKLKMLKRHLRTSYDLTPEAYRDKWKLPADYPMVAPGYASHRSDIAKKTGLGHQRKPAPRAVVTTLPARRAKGSKG